MKYGPRHRNRTLQACLIAPLLALSFGTFAFAMQDPASDMAAPDTSDVPIQLSYEFYGAGFHLATLEADATLGPARYEIATRATSRGLADTLANARLDANASGLLDRDGPATQAFRTSSDTNFGQRRLEMTRAAGGTFDITLAEPALEPRQTAVLNSGMADGALDPLTAAIYAVLRPENLACQEDVHVFDGRRTFSLAFTRSGTEHLEESGQATYVGPAILCRMRYVPIAGQSREWELEEARDPSPPISLWLARFETGIRPVLLPVRVKLESRWGSALAHLTTARIDGEAVLGETGAAPSRRQPGAK